MIHANIDERVRKKTNEEIVNFQVLSYAFQNEDKSIINV